MMNLKLFNIILLFCCVKKHFIEQFIATIATSFDVRCYAMSYQIQIGYSNEILSRILYNQSRMTQCT